MTYFAEIDPEDALPTRVIGWYDTEFATYQNMPNPDRLIEMDASQWAARMTTPRYDGESFIPDPPPPRFVPPTVTLFQCRAALMQSGLFNRVDAAVKAQGGIALQAWEYANEVSRSGALVLAMAGSLGLSADDVDDMFIEAAGITA